MRIDLADNIKIGDTIYNCFMDSLVVSSITKQVSDDSGYHKIIFDTIDTRLNHIKYDANDLYLHDLYGESDDEKSWINWAKENRDFFAEFDHIETMREIYKIGFCNGFEHKRKTLHEELMQK